MNIQEYDLMNCIMEQEYVNQRILSEITRIFFGKGKQFFEETDRIRLFR